MEPYGSRSRSTAAIQGTSTEYGVLRVMWLVNLGSGEKTRCVVEWGDIQKHGNAMGYTTVLVLYGVRRRLGHM